MISLNLIEMRKKVKEEVSHIHKTNLYQSYLRQYYATLRMASLGKKAQYPDDKNEILRLSIENVKNLAKKDGSDFKPRYDTDFFSFPIQ